MALSCLHVVVLFRKDCVYWVFGVLDNITFQIVLKLFNRFQSKKGDHLRMADIKYLRHLGLRLLNFMWLHVLQLL